MAETIPIDKIPTEGTQTRAELNQTIIAEYAEAYEQGIELPPIEVYFDQALYWLADGFHRVKAAQKIGRDSISANVSQGGQRQAILFSVKANDTHGLRRTAADRRNAIRILLTDPEWSQWSNSEIARQCNVSEHLVRIVFSEIKPRETKLVKEETKKARRAGKEYTVRTGRIGTSRKTSKVELPVTAVEQTVPPVTEAASELPAEALSSPTSKIEPDAYTAAPAQEPPADTIPRTSSNTEPDVLKTVDEAPPLPTEFDHEPDHAISDAIAAGHLIFDPNASTIPEAVLQVLTLPRRWELATSAEQREFVTQHRDELQKIFRKLERAASS